MAGMKEPKSEAGAGAFGQWALLLAGARRHGRAGAERDAGQADEENAEGREGAAEEAAPEWLPERGPGG
jgi:hypothetical protein